MVARVLCILGTTAIIVLCFPWEKTTEYAHLSVGSVVPEEIIAPFDFEVLKNPTELEKDRLLARQSVNPVFIRNDSITEHGLSQFDQVWTTIQRISARARQDGIPIASLSVMLKDSLRDRYPITLETTAWTFLGQVASESAGSKRFAEPLSSILANIYARGILDASADEIETPDGKIALIEQGEESLVDAKPFLDLSAARADVLERLKKLYPASRGVQLNAPTTGRELDSLKVAYKLLISFLEPNVVFDREVTDHRREVAVSQVPTVKGLVLKNERIVDSNVRLTQDQLDKLRSLDVRNAELVRIRGGLRFLIPILGRALLVLGLLILLGWVLNILGHYVVSNLRHLFVLCIIVILPVVAASMLVLHAHLSPVYLPITVSVILASALFNVPIALGVSIITSVLVAAVAGYDFSAFVFSLFPSLVAILAVRGAHTRSKIMKTAIPIAITYVFTVILIHLLEYSFGTPVLREMSIGAINAIFSPIVAMGLLIPLEQISGITTDLTLLELSDLNRPLLRRLALETPGTYHHSIVVGNLAEAAAEAIGANPLLVRVGAYYHDIGKIENKEYFIENQGNRDNIHDLISPETSAAILKDHVTKGLEIAKQYRLPQVVRDFIPQHHGTNLILYFYYKAIKRENPGSIDLNKYRYPGPNPQSREAAILMLADIVEATFRSWKDPDIEDIKRAVEQSIQARLNEGELDDCDLTLKDIKLIRNAFARVLSGTVHQRIEYPSEEDLEPAKSEIVKPPDQV
jgi:hypothetical protein